MSPVHPARSLSVEDRIAYLAAAASFVLADHAPNESELGKLRELCAALDLDDAATARVIEEATHPDQARVAEVIARYRQNELRFALLIDAIVICFADGHVNPSEAERIARMAEALHVHTAETVMLGRFVQDVLKEGAPESLTQELAKGLAIAAHHVPHHSGIRSLFDRLRSKKTG